MLTAGAGAGADVGAATILSPGAGAAADGSATVDRTPWGESHGAWLSTAMTPKQPPPPAIDTDLRRRCLNNAAAAC